MKIHDFPVAPNPRKLRTYIGEKGIEIPFVLVDLRNGEQKSPEFLAKNPLGNLPVLELDDGSFLTESLAIIEYLEELYPDPPMIGTTPLERARVRRLERICDLGVLGRAARWVHSTKSPLGLPPNEEVASAALEELPPILQLLDDEMGDQPFLAGANPTIADCTLFGASTFAGFFGLDIPAVGPGFPNLRRWLDDFAKRSSTAISL